MVRRESLTRQQVRSFRRRAVSLVGLVVVLCGCGPLDQSATMLDERTNMPSLVLALCADERVEAVRLTAVELTDYSYEEGETLWLIEADEPQALERFVIGEVPVGFDETIPLSDNLPDDLALFAETDGGSARMHGGPFTTSELRPGVLMRGDFEATQSDLEHDADVNCTSSFFGSFGLPKWLDKVAVVALGIAGAAGVVMAIRSARRTKRRQLTPNSSGPAAWPAPHPDEQVRGDG